MFPVTLSNCSKPLFRQLEIETGASGLPSYAPITRFCGENNALTSICPYHEHSFTPTS